MSMLATVAMVAVLTGPPVPATTATIRPAMPWVELHRRQIVSAGREASTGWKLAARVGAALAWDLADLPGHQTGATQPWGAYASPASYPAVPLCGPMTPVPGGEIGALITRWNVLYPPFALSSIDARDASRTSERSPRSDLSEEPSCPGK